MKIEDIDTDEDRWGWDEDKGPKILCPYCNKPFDSTMRTKFEYSMGTEQTGIYGEKCSVKIFCNKCDKLVYKKN